MEMLCPECKGALVVDGETAHCALHDRQFRILFTRLKTPAAARLQMQDIEYRLTPGAFCLQHPGVAATHVCHDCGAAVCDVCFFAEADGTMTCPACARRRHNGSNTASESLVTGIPKAVRCVQHPSVSATKKCQGCGAFMCDTCDFALPGDIHVCPACAAAPQGGLSPKRKRLLYSSLALGVWCTIGLVLLLFGIFAAKSAGDEAALGIVITFFLIVPSIIGLALGLSAMDRRLQTPLLLWIATIWNGLIVFAMLVLCFVGALKK